MRDFDSHSKMLSRFSNFTRNERSSFAKNTRDASYIDIQSQLQSIKHLDFSEARIEGKKPRHSDALADVYEAKMCMPNGNKVKVELRQIRSQLLLNDRLCEVCGHNISGG